MSVLEQSDTVRRKVGNLVVERVLDVRHYTDTLFSFRATRAPSFRFESGQFTMIGLEIEGRPLLRAYRCTRRAMRSRPSGPW